MTIRQGTTIISGGGGKVTSVNGEIGDVVVKSVVNQKDSSTQLKFWLGTQEEYETITEKDDATIYYTQGEDSSAISYDDLTDKPTINTVPLSGDMTLAELGIQGELEPGTGITIENGVISATVVGGVTSVNGQTGDVTVEGLKDQNTVNTGLLKFWTGTKEQYAEIETKDPNTLYYVGETLTPATLSVVAQTGSYNDLLDKPDIPEAYVLPKASTDVLGGVKVDGNTITIDTNGVISASASTPGTTNYTDLSNKPQINGTTLEGNKTLTDLGIQAAGDYALSSNIPVNTSDLANDSGFITKEVSNLTNYTPTSSLATVATTGDYNDLENLPDVSHYVTLNTNQTISGAKYFEQYICRKANNITSMSTGSTYAVDIRDKDEKSLGGIITYANESNALKDLNNNAVAIRASDTITNPNDAKYGEITVRVFSDGTYYGTYGGGGGLTPATLQLPNLNEASSQNSTCIPWLGLLNNPTQNTNLVHKTGNETISDTKTFNQIVTPHLIRVNTTIDTKVTDNGEQENALITGNNTDGNVIAQLTTTRTSTHNSARLRCSSSNNHWADLRIRNYDNGDVRVTIDGIAGRNLELPTSQNDYTVPHTKWVKSLFQVVSVLPAEPDPNVFYFIPEE